MCKSSKKEGYSCLRRVLDGFMVIVFTLCFGLLMQPVDVKAATSLSVDLSSVIQNNYLGTGAVYHGFAYMPESNSKGYTDALRNIEFTRVANMNLHLARTYYRADWACGQSGYPSYDWNSTKMTAFYNWLQAMKDRNVDVAINAAWWCTNDVYNVYPFSSADPATWSTRETQWAAWMSESLNQIITVRGFTNVKYVFLFTEADYQSGTLPSGYTQYQAYKEACTTLHNKLVADGRRSLVKLVGPNYSGFTSVSQCVTDLNNVIDIYTSHDYSYADYTAWYNAAVNLKNQISSTGKPFWIDEYGKTDEAYRGTADYGNYIAQIVAAYLNAGAQSSQIWLLFDQQYVWPQDTLTNADSFYNGVHKWGTAQFLPTSQVPRPSYYAFTLMSKYMGGPGTQVYSTTNGTGVYISATKQPSGDWSFLVVNGNASAQDITVNLSGAINKTLYRYLYDPAAVTPDSSATMIGYDKTFSSVSTSFSDTIPSKAVVVYSSVNGGAASPPPDGTNLALYKTVTSSSSSTDAGWGQAYAVDGQRSSVSGSYGWSSNSSTSTNHTEWITVDMGTNRTINRVDLYPRNDLPNTGYGFPVDFTIQVSTDNTTWTTVVTQTSYPLPSGTVQTFTFGSQNARYVKIQGTNLRQNPNDLNLYRMQFAEIEIYNTGTNLALYKTVTSSSSSTDAGWGQAYAVDGQRSSVPGSYGWSSNSSTSTNHTEWITVDMGASYTINRVDLYPRNDLPNTGYGFPVDFTIQVSTDNTTWTTVVTQTSYPLPSGTVQTFTFGSQNARYVKIQGTNLRQNPNDLNLYRMQFAEIEVYNATSGTNLVTNPGFEADGAAVQSPIGWSTSGTDPDADYTEATSGGGGPHSGSYKLVHYKSTAYNVYTYQTKTGLPNGLYTLKAWIKNDYGGLGTAYMEAKDFGGTSMTYNIPTSSTWTQISINNINVTSGQCTIGFYSNTPATYWYMVDDVEFYQQ